MTTAMHRAKRAPIPQNRPLRADQIKNAAGGYVFQTSQMTALRRFLLLGTDGGTYYTSEFTLTQQGMNLVAQCVEQMQPKDFIEAVVDCANTAPKRTYALYALSAALAAPVQLGHGREARELAVKAVRDVVKTGTDMFELISYIEMARGWGATAQRAVNEILLGLDVEKLGLWTVKYRDRHGWTWRDALRVAHPKRNPHELHNQRRGDLFDVMLGKEKTTGVLVVDGWQEARKLKKDYDVIAAVRKYGLPWEALTDEQRTDEVWMACLPFIGDQAVLRNLAGWTRRGLTQDRAFSVNVIERLERAAKLHPVTVLNALKTYGSGGRVGRSQGGAYIPYTPWLTALEGSLNQSFTKGVNSTGLRTYVGLDVSGSMGALVNGSAVLSCREVGAALALAVAKNESLTETVGFTSGSNRATTSRTALTHLPFGKLTSFQDAMRTTSRLAFGATDCALPMLDAMDRKLLVDLFVVITDNETWYGNVHPAEALKQYRQKSGVHKAKLAVVALTATNRSIADPKDPGMMDFVGFSSDLPKALEVFATAL